MRCLDCRGHGSHAGGALETCQDCQTGAMACKAHMCRTCSGSGDVCPSCHGMRFVRKQEWDISHGTIVEIERCPRCWDAVGNKVDPVRERRAIDRYLVRWRYEQGQPIATVVAVAETPPETTQQPQPPTAPPTDKLDAALAAARARSAYQPPRGPRPRPLPPFIETTEGGVR